PDARNKWTIIEENDTKTGLLMQNTLTNHEFPLGYDSIREFRTPDLLTLRGQIVLKKDGVVELEPFTEGPDVLDTGEMSTYIADRYQLAGSQLRGLTIAERAADRDCHNA
ncbi:MAG: hypothetical protein WAP47_00590, partial [Candidatus Rokuibacteriota bacterium]